MDFLPLLLAKACAVKNVLAMIAFPPKADIGTQPLDVRFVPKADIP